MHTQMHITLRAQIVLFGCILNKVSASSWNRSDSLSSISNSSGKYSAFDPAFQINVKIQCGPASNFKERIFGKKTARGTLDIVTNEVTINEPGGLEFLSGEIFRVSKETPDSTSEKKTPHFHLTNNERVMTVKMNPVKKEAQEQFRKFRLALCQPIKIPVTFNTFLNRHEGSGFVLFNDQKPDEIPQLEVHAAAGDAHVSDFRHEEGKPRPIKFNKESAVVVVYKYDITRIDESSLSTKRFRITPHGKLHVRNAKTDIASDLEWVSIQCGSCWEWAKLKLMRHLRSLPAIEHKQHLTKRREDMLKQFQNESINSEKVFEDFLEYEQQIKSGTADWGIEVKYNKAKQLLRQNGFSIEELRDLKQVSEELNDVEFNLPF